MRLSTERILQEAVEQEQAEALGRGRDESRGEKSGYRKGYETGPLKTGEGVFHVKVPQIRGQAAPYRSQLWSHVSGTREVLKQLIVELYVGGMSQRDIEQGVEKAVGHLLLSQRTVREIAESLAEEYAAFRTRDLRPEPIASLLIDTGYEPVRRWGQKPGVRCVWAIGEDGRKVLLSLSTANRESLASCRAVLGDLVKRGLRPPATITTDGAIGLTQASEAVWPKALRIRCWFHKMQNLQQKVPAQAWPAVKALLVDRRDAPSREKAEQRREAMGERSQREFPELCRCLLEDTDASLNPLEVPQRHQQYVRTSNLVERAFVEERRRTTVSPHLWTEGSLGHLVCGVLIRVSDRWGKKCVSEFEQQPIRSLRARLKLDEQEVSTNEVSVHVPTRRSAASAA